MADQESANSFPPSSSLSESLSTFIVPPSLKFLIANIKNLVSTQLTAETYAIWRTQILQHFTANGFAGHLNGSQPCPPITNHANHRLWHLIDSNLISALFSTISPSILPYVLSSSSAHEIWEILQRRLQPLNRSQVLQLKNELHNVQLNLHRGI